MTRLRLAAAAAAVALWLPAGAVAMTTTTRHAISRAREVFQHHLRPRRRLRPQAVPGHGRRLLISRTVRHRMMVVGPLRRLVPILDRVQPLYERGREMA